MRNKIDPCREHRVCLLWRPDRKPETARAGQYQSCQMARAVTGRQRRADRNAERGSRTKAYGQRAWGCGAKGIFVIYALELGPSATVIFGKVSDVLPMVSRGGRSRDTRNRTPKE
jgi:hypothetical protein